MGKRSRKTAADLAEELVQEFGKPDPVPEEWHAHYTPEQVVEYAAEVVDLEAQLDEHWKGWRLRQPFATHPLDKIGWIKLRLKRRDMILHGHGAWGVHLVHRNDYPYAIPVRPARVPVEDRSAYGPLVSVPQLARRLRQTPEAIRAALALRPADVRDVSGWLASHFGSGGAGGAAAPLPASPDPVGSPGPAKGGPL